MTRFEEDVVECYYNLEGYFTAKNIQFPAIEKRPGGKGRGEIDLLAVKIGNRGNVEEAIWIEIGVSITARFPFISRSVESIDSVRKLLKKFFESDADYKIKQYLKDFKYKRLFISSEFSSKTKDNLVNRLRELKAKVIRVNQKNNRISITIKFRNLKNKNITEDIEILPFSKILEGLREIFHKENLITNDFQDPRLRAIQYLVVQSNKKRTFS